LKNAYISHTIVHDQKPIPPAINQLGLGVTNVISWGSHTHASGRFSRPINFNNDMTSFANQLNVFGHQGRDVGYGDDDPIMTMTIMIMTTTTMMNEH